MCVMACRGVCVAVCLVLLSGVHCNNGLDELKATAAPRTSRPKVHCWSSVYPHQTLCSWDGPQQQSLPTYYIATYSERRRPSVTKQCRLIPPGSSSSALNPVPSPSPGQRVWLCVLEDLKLLTDYIVNVTAVHSLGSSSYLTSFMMEDIVKPDPPVDVRLSPKGLRKLEWSPPPTWSNLDIFPLKYLIQYQRQNSSKIVHLGPYESTGVVLKLAPRRTYRVQVCAMELLDLGECSNWSKPLKFTMP